MAVVHVGVDQPHKCSRPQIHVFILLRIASLEDHLKVLLSHVDANVDMGFGAHMVFGNNCIHRGMLSIVNTSRGHKG